MKTIYLFVVFFLSASCAFAQSNRARVSLSVEARDKWPIYRAIDETPKAAVRNLYHEPEYSLSFNLAYRFAKNLQAEIGYSKEDFRIKGKVPDYTETGNSLLKAYMFSCRIKYKIPVVPLFKRNLYLLPALGYTLGINNSYGGVSFFDGIIQTNLEDLILTQYYRRGFEYNLRRSFNLLELRGQIGYELSTDIDVYFCGGYAHGFNTIGILNMAYYVVNGPSGTVKTETQGTNFYLLAGLAFHFRRQTLPVNP